MADQNSPLVKALPPESDYLTYLTVVEYNLSQESLPTLHHVLQDEKLATNIGWDLVALLMPYLPDSEECLHDIARLGNPREVILKVTEFLRLIDYGPLHDEDEHGPSEFTDDKDARDQADSTSYPLKTAPTSDDESKTGQATEVPPPLPLPTKQFTSLLSMLTMLHRRTKTKYPSRFLSTSLQAILASFSNASAHREEMILSIVNFVKPVSGTKRPTLPSRKSSAMLGSGPGTEPTVGAADPEGTSDSRAPPEESAIQMKLCQSFVTHVIEEYVLNLDSAEEDIPGLAWCSRIMEKAHPERNIPEKKTFVSRFANEQFLQRRIDAVGQLVTLAQDLNLTDDALLATATSDETMVDQDDKGEDEPPASADDIPLSKLGCLILYAARQVSSTLSSTARASTTPPLTLFPTHQSLLTRCLSPASQGSGTLGSEPSPLLDAVLAIGLIALLRDAIGEPASDETFSTYLETTALLSSAIPSPNLRGHAHYLATTTLRSQPDERVRLAFIRDTLEHCPFENLKVSAVGWIKGETIEANPPHADPSSISSDNDANGEPSIFATPYPLDSLAPHLFPSLNLTLPSTTYSSPFTDEDLATFRANLPFYLASLNFLYLLLCAKHLHAPLDIQDLWTNGDVAGSFLGPLREVVGRLRGEQEIEEEVKAELNVLEETVERVTKAVGILNAS